tara:strand:- start:1455 stop:2384 length:930 start_codon:yes stop_codon:yes gene_type:complete
MNYGDVCMRQIEFKFTKDIVAFDVVDSSVADAWWNQMQLRKNIEPLTPVISMEPDFPAYRDINECQNNIIENVELMKQYNFDFDWPEDIDSITQQNLNSLHQDFHHKEEIYKHELPQDAHDTLQKINQFVHQMEQIMWSKNNDRQNYAVLDFGSLETELKIQRPIADNERQWFSEAYYEQACDTALLLGYCTLGKHLGHCTWTNDTQVVKDNMLRPQEYIYTQVLFRHSSNFVNHDMKTIDKINQDNHQQQHDWVQKNNLQSYVDTYNPKHMYNTAPVVAFVNKKHQSYTEDDWHDIWLKQKWIGIELL